MADIRYRTVESLQSKLMQLTKGFRYTIDTSLLNDGDKCEDSQRICLLNALKELEDRVFGITEDDMK